MKEKMTKLRKKNLMLIKNEKQDKQKQQSNLIIIVPTKSQERGGKEFIKKRKVNEN